VEASQGSRIAIRTRDRSVLTHGELERGTQRLAGGMLDAGIALYKVPGWIWIEPSLPITPVGKVDRHLLQERAARRLVQDAPPAL
jgi:non-ribosomal peptide synthetase component E (peptide arylation enzyme)